MGQNVVALPAGSITFLLTDVEGSTRLWEEDPQRMTRALEQHDRIVAAIVESHGGRVIKSKGEGDSTFCVFARPLDAALAADELQRRLAAEPWPTARPIAVRIAIHSGEAQERDADYFGPVVNRSARLRAIAHGGQTVVSGGTAETIKPSLPSGVELRDLGTHRLKDLTEPEQVFQLQPAGEPIAFPPLRSLNAFRHNLPVQLTSFVGREVEIAEVMGLLDRARLVSIVGTGGVGKTRLALQVAADMVDRFTAGAWLVPLEALSVPDLVPAAIAGALGLREQADREFLDVVVEHLAEREAMIVLDNCEHLVATCAEIAERLLKTAADLRIIATSREPLEVPGEAVWRIPGLRIPASARPTVTDLSEHESTRLFLDRAALVQHNFAPGPEDVEPIVRVCRRLDGIPLAIELAAARLAVLSTTEIAARLDDRFDLLAGGRRTAIPRQQTLRATIEWSHELLPEPERALLRRLSVFSGGFTVQSAEAVTGASSGELLDRIGLLVKKSLVVHDRASMRYRMLETILAFGREKLHDSGEAEEFAARHLRWCVELVERAAPELRGPQEARWFETLSAEHDNFRAALDGVVAPPDPEAALRLAGTLGPFWSWKGFSREGGARLDRALAAGDGVPSHARAIANSNAGYLAWNRGEYGRARAFLEEAVRMLREFDDAPRLSYALSGLGTVLLNLGDEGPARALYEERLRMAEEAGDKAGISSALNGLGEVARSEGNYVRAREHYEKSVAVAREGELRGGLALFLANLGHAQALLDEAADARRSFDESIRLATELGHGRILRVCLQGLGALSANAGDPERAARIIGAVEAAAEMQGETIERVDARFIERVARTVRQAIGEQRLELLRAEGGLLTVDEALTLALGEPATDG